MIKPMSFDSSDNSDTYLKISRDGNYTNKSEKRIALVTNGTAKIAKNGAPYYILYLRDMDGVLVTAFVFDVTEYIKSGFDLEKVKGAFIQFNYYINIFGKNNNYSLLLENIGLVDNPDYELVSKFLGEVPELSNKIKYINENLTNIPTNINMPQLSVLDSNHDVRFCNNKLGGFLNLVYLTVKQLQALKEVYSTQEYLYCVNVLKLFVIFTKELGDKTSVLDISCVASKLEQICTDSNRDIISELTNYLLEKDVTNVYVRTILDIFCSTKKFTDERDCILGVPYTCSSNAGYGTITRYKL